LPLAWLTLMLVRVVDWFAHFPRWSYRIPGPPVWLMTAFFVLALLLCVTLRLTFGWQRYAARSVCGGLIICALLIATYPFARKWSPGKLELSVLDVGQGDSLFVVSPHGRAMLIDGGGSFGGFSEQEEHNGIDPGEDAVSPYLWSRGFQRLDFAVLTHAHQDHLGGLLAIVENFRVEELWLGREVSVPKLARLEEIARSKNTAIKHQLRGLTFQWDGVEGQFLWPDTPTPEIASVAKNDDSLVLRRHYGERTLLLPGDAEKDAEREILAENNAKTMQADILKAGHHGSKNSTMPDFLMAVSPRVAIISAGEDNAYGHPSPELLKRLDSAHVHVLRTDQNGAVHVLTDGERVEVRCYVPCNELAEQPLRAQAPDFPQKSQKQ
jgi:competence protein ComEC